MSTTCWDISILSEFCCDGEMLVGSGISVAATVCRSRYMISNETLFHKNPQTGEPQMIGLGWLDDSMQLKGPTEEDKNVSVQLLAYEVRAHRYGLLIHCCLCFGSISQILVV